MAQHDQVIANDSAANVRADINNALAALFGSSSGSSAPSTTIAYQFWADTTNGLLKIRNATNSAWITLGAFDASDFRLLVSAGAVGTPSHSTSGDTNTGMWFPAADTIALSVGGSEAARVNSSGNVGIGVTSPGQRLHLANSGASSVFALFTNSATGNTASDGVYVGVNSAGAGYLWQQDNFALLFGTNNGERLRIDADGDLVVGGASASDWTAASRVAVEVSTGRALSLQNTGASGGCLVARVDNTGAAYASFYSGVTEVGSITTNGSATAFNTSSDVRLKQDIADLGDTGETIDAIRPRSFTWRATGVADVGFVAQELAPVVPGAVTEGETWGVDASKLMPYVVGELQRLRARVAALERR